MSRGINFAWPSAPLAIACVISLISLAVILQRASDRWYLGHATSPPTLQLRRVAFDASNSDVELRADVRKGDEADLHDYSTFYAWLSRFGKNPLFTNSAYDSPDMPALLINPKRRIWSAESREILSYVRRGGRLLLLCDPSSSSARELNQLLATLGMRLEAVRGDKQYFDANGPDFQSNLLALPFDILATSHAARGQQRLRTQYPAYSLTGVTPLLVDEEGVVIAGERKLGKGRVTVFTRSLVFSEFVFGDVWGGKELENGKLQLYEFARELTDHAYAESH